MKNKKSSNKNLNQQTISKLSAALEYTFKNCDLLELGLTHKSVSDDNNERLEFLGDSILNFSISSIIFEKFSNMDEGELTRIRSELVSRKALAVIAKNIDLGLDVILSPSEKAAGGHQRTSILANCLEAIFGVVYLDSDIETARTVIKKLYQQKLEDIFNSGGVAKDAKTRLQEWLQEKAHALPEYTVLNISGKPHEQVFKVECSVAFLDKVVKAEGNSRRNAEQTAAKKILAIIEEQYKI